MTTSIKAVVTNASLNDKLKNSILYGTSYNIHQDGHGDLASQYSRLSTDSIECF